VDDGACDWVSRYTFDLAGRRVAIERHRASAVAQVENGGRYCPVHLAMYRLWESGLLDLPEVPHDVIGTDQEVVT
jgi:hypothetical protein